MKVKVTVAIDVDIDTEDFENSIGYEEFKAKVLGKIENFSYFDVSNVNISYEQLTCGPD